MGRVQMMKCPFCGERVEEDAVFCANCGKKIADDKTESPVKETEVQSVEVKHCPKCGKELNVSDEFCDACGEKINKPHSKKKKGIPIIIAVIIIVLLAGGATGVIFKIRADKKAAELAEIARQEEVKEYCKKCKELVAEIRKSKTNFDILNTMFDTASGMDGNYLVTRQDYIDYCVSLCSGEISEERNRKSTVDTLYNDIIENRCEDPDVTELSNVVDDYYSAYKDMYDLLVLQKFSATSYKISFSEIKSRMDDANQKYNVTINPLNVTYLEEE